MAAIQQILWLSPSMRTRRSEVDGSRLMNWYTSPTRDATYPGGAFTLHSAPGYKRWAQVPPLDFMRGGATVSPEAGIFGMVSMDSPVYGKRLLGVSSEYQFFQIIDGGIESYDLPSGYNPFDPNQTLHEVDANRIENYTDVFADRATGPVRIATDGRRAVFVHDNNVRMFDCDVNDFITIQAPTPTDQSATLPDEEWVDVTWIDGYFIIAARSGEMFHSRLNSSVFDQLDLASAGAKPDPIVGLQSFGRRLYVFGSESVEQWFNAGRTFFAFARDNTYVAEIGAASRDTIQSNEAGIFFLASDGIVYGLAGSSYRRFSNETIERDIKNSETEKARAFTYTEEGHRFYSLTLINGSTRINWTLDTTTGFWHERSETNILAQAKYLNYNLIGREGDAYIHNLDRRWGNHDGTDVVRQATAPTLWANVNRVRVESFEFEATYGEDVAVATDEFQLSISKDVRNTWEDFTLDATDKSSGRLRFIDLGEYSDQLNFRLQTSINKRIDIKNTLYRVELAPN